MKKYPVSETNNKETVDMLRDMYDAALTAADLRVICKSRDFYSDEVSSTPLFESVFLTEKGLKSAFGSLTQAEIALLHVLNFINKAVDVTFFEYFYGDRDSDTGHYQSFATRYTDIFKKVRVSLVRKGILLFAESANTWGRTTKLERWQFRFPEEFYPFLPSPFTAPEIFDARSGIRNDIFRRKIKQVVTGTRIPDESTGYVLRLSHGKLQIKGHEYRMKYLKKWQVESWHASAMLETKTRKGGVHPLQLVIYVLSQLNQNEWILPDDLSIFWNILYPEGKAPDNRNICETGWNWGYLLKQELKGQSYYRLAGTLDTQEPESYLRVTGNQPVILDLETVPYENLDLLVQISKMAVLDSQLQISPDLIAIGNAQSMVRNHPLTLWLSTNSSLFREVIEKVDKRWGKLVIHENLMVARIMDLSLVVKLQRSFPDQIKPIAKNVIAFPRDSLPAIQKLAAGAGYVIKTVKDVNYEGENNRD
ncbi:hypothetical protein C5S29_13005 [ANME-1 cluster archaeon GoMg3.2]|nr:hypothetical protein [ANME-1 cluster archaeon GoMg3.2]